MNVFERMLSTQALMFIYMVVGVIIVKTRLLQKEGRSSLIGILINITLPCMILHSFEQDVGIQELIAAGQAMIISACCCVASYLIGVVIWRRKPAEKRAVLEFATMFSNQGNAGLPIIQLVFGSQGVFYTSFLLIPVRVLMWTLGVSLFVKQEGKARWRTLLVNPSLLVVFAGLFILLTPFKLPQVFSTAITNIGNMTGPLSMMLIGASLADMNLREALDRDAFLLSAVRLLGLPVLAMLILRALPVEPMIWQVQAVLIAMPAASNTAILAEMYGRDHSFAAKCVFITTILSLITVPCLTLLF